MPFDYFLIANSNVIEFSYSDDHLNCVDRDYLSLVSTICYLYFTALRWINKPFLKKEREISSLLFIRSLIRSIQQCFTDNFDQVGPVILILISFI